MKQWVAVGVFAMTTVWAQSPSISHHTINGYDVYLVNSHRGNSVYFGVNVQVGMDHDDPVRTPGLTHLFEHVIHEGSEAFPGHGTLEKVLQDLGLERNAYTSHNQTFYYFSGHESVFEKAIVPYGAMFSRPEWNAETFVNEREVVKNEALEYQRRGRILLEAMLLTKLLPDGHQLAKYSIGTQSQLSATTVEDARQLFHANYVPGSMQIFVTANFDGGGVHTLRPERVLELLQQNFVPPEPRGLPARQMKMPPFVSRDVDRRMIEVVSPQTEHRLMLQFRSLSVGDYDWAATEMVRDFLMLDRADTLVGQLKRKGWITDLSASDATTNDSRLNDIEIDLTAEGAKNRAQVLDFVFSFLGRVQVHGITSESLDYLTRINLASYGEVIESPSRYNQSLARSILRGLDPLKAFDYEGFFGGMTGERFRRALAESFDPAQVVGGYLGADVEGDSWDPIFERRYRILDSKADLARWSQMWRSGGNVGDKPFGWEFRTVPLGRGLIANETSLARDLRLEGGRSFWHIRPIRDSKTSALHLSLLGPVLDLKDQARLKVFLDAFKEHYRAELQYLMSLNILHGLAIGGGRDIEICVKAEPIAAHDALKWLISSLWTYRPSDSEMNTVIESLRSDAIAYEDSFTAALAVHEAIALRSKTLGSPRELFGEMEGLLVDDGVRKGLPGILRHQDVQAAVVGSWSDELSERLTGSLRRWVAPRTDLQIAERKADGLIIQQNVSAFRPLAATKAAGAFGVAQVFASRELDIRHWALRHVAADMLKDLVFQQNRVEQKLGYVQGATFLGVPQGIRLVLYGQTEGIEDAPKIEAGWRDVISRVQSDPKMKQTAEDYIRAAILSMRRLPENLLEAAAEDLQHIDLWDRAGVRSEVVAMLESLGPDDVLRFVNESYTPERSIRLVAAHVPDCSRAIRGLALIRSHASRTVQ